MTAGTPVMLSAAGLRVTRQRIAVLDAIDAGEHLDVDAITYRARNSLGSISTQAVYDVLRALDIAGLVRRIQPASQPALYEIRVGDNHHHLVCRQCGEVSDIECVTGLAPCLDAPLPEGFDADEAEITWWGTCAACRTAEPSRKS
jgi:Fur family transcriptional regulator, stress-responsive regulator